MVIFPHGALSFLSSELDEEARALQALLSSIGKPLVSIHFSWRLCLDLISTLCVF